MLQAERDYLVRTIGYFERCVAGYDTFLSRTKESASADPVLREVMARCQEECARWRDEIELILNEGYDC